MILCGRADVLPWFVGDPARDLSSMVVWEPDVGDCWVCGQPAEYLDLSFEAPVCGGICVWAAWEALRLHDTPWRAW